MSLLWTSVSVLLCVELVILVALCAPLPWGVRKNISRTIHRLKLHHGLDAGIKYIIFALFLALAESLNALNYVHRKMAETGDDELLLTRINNTKWLKARAERNMYLAAFAITGVMTIWRLVRLAANEVSLREKIKELNGGKPITESGETLDTKQN